ncbi:30S ribosomal protein S19, partial [Dysosmobacter welbionis]
GPGKTRHTGTSARRRRSPSTRGDSSSPSRQAIPQPYHPAVSAAAAPAAMPHPASAPGTPQDPADPSRPSPAGYGYADRGTGRRRAAPR